AEAFALHTTVFLPIPPLLPLLPLLPFLPFPPFQFLDIHTERDTARGRGRIRAEPSAHQRKRLVIERQPPARSVGIAPLHARERLESPPQRRAPRALPRIGREERAPREERRHDGDRQEACVGGMPPAPRERAAADQESAEEKPRNFR